MTLQNGKPDALAGRRRDANGKRADLAIGVLCAMGAASIWGGSSVVSRYLISTDMGALELTFLRYAACFPVAVIIYAIGYPRLVSRLSFKAFLIMVLLAGPPFHFLVIAGYAYLPAGLGAVLIAGLLATATMLSAPLLRNVKIQRGQVVALAMLLCGLGLIARALVTPEFGSWSSLAMGGLIFGLAALLWTLLNHLVQSWQVDPLSLTINRALCSPLFLIAGLIGLDFNALQLASLEDVMLQLVYHGLLVALAATFLFFTAVRRLGPGSAGLTIALAPALAIILGGIVLGEQLTVISLAGVVLVLGGFLMALGAER